MRRRGRTVTVGSGEWRGRVLGYPDHPSLRPTMQRTKHSFFSSLGDALRGAVFADCFAGAGGVGIEALSLGAGHVHFVELRREAVEALYRNLALCGAQPTRYHVHHARVAELVAREPNPLRGASILFADPPYETDIEREFLDVVDPARFESLDVVVVEHRSKRRLVVPAGLHIDRERRFGETTLTFLVPGAAQEGE